MGLRLFIGVLALLVWGCSPVKEITKTSAILTQSSQDSTEYEILIIDIHLDLWYQTNYSPAKYRTNEYYQYKTGWRSKPGIIITSRVGTAGSLIATSTTNPISIMELS